MSRDKWLERSGLVEKWRTRTITNFEFLMELNKFAGRTYDDLAQDPIFPWVLSNYRLGPFLKEISLNSVMLMEREVYNITVCFSLSVCMCLRAYRLRVIPLICLCRAIRVIGN